MATKPPRTAPPGAQFTAPTRAAPAPKPKPKPKPATGGGGNPTYTPDSGNPLSGVVPIGAGGAANTGTQGGGVNPVTPEQGMSNYGVIADTAQVDWSNYLSLFGMPKELIDHINAMPKTGNLDIDATNILGYIRGTPWYANTYPGIADAIAKGAVTDERDYRQKQNQFNQIWNQYYGKNITTPEFGSFIGQGLSADIVQRQIIGGQYVEANRNDIQYLAGNFGEGLLNPDQLQQVGRNQAGLGTPQGANYQAMLDKALQRSRRVFEGTLANLGNPRSLAPSTQNPTDIGR